MSDVRSGSTLLENILSNAENTLSVGELHHLDSHLYKGKWGKTWNWTCTCGKNIIDCEFWGKILSNLKNKKIKVDNTSLKKVNKNDSGLEVKEKYDYNKKVIKLINEIYAAVFEETGSDIIIDSSKHTEHGFELYKKSNYKIKIIYLKRDIRAVVLSKLKWAKKFGHKNSSIYKTLYGTKLHDIFLKKQIKQVANEDIIRVSYEELAKKPQETINKIIKKFELPYFNVPEYMDFSCNHTIGGTPNRFEKSKIMYDNGWKKQSNKMPFFHMIAKVIDFIS
jgi:hypothetical protein